jgi:hypothetical protein
MFVNRNYFSFFGPMVSYLIIYIKPQNTMKFKRRQGEFEQGCVTSESNTATDALPPILPACRKPLLPACVFVTRDTIRHPRLFFWKICSWTDLFLMRGVREPRFHCICLNDFTLHSVHILYFWVLMLCRFVHWHHFTGTWRLHPQGWRYLIKVDAGMISGKMWDARDMAP